MTTTRRKETSKGKPSNFDGSNGFHRWSKLFFLSSIIAYNKIIPAPFYASAFDNRSNVNSRAHLHLHRPQPEEESDTSRPEEHGSSSNGDDNNGLIQIIESEVWDASENSWKASAVPGTERGNRWSNEKGQISPSPAEVVPPEGWQFLGEWKIVVSSSSSSSSTNNNGVNVAGSGGGGDAKGWEYQFQYLQPPRRRRIWLRSLTPKKSTALQPKSSASLPRLVVKSPPPTVSTSTMAKAKKLQRRRRFKRMFLHIWDDWNYKGMGFSLYKSLIWPSSFGMMMILPLSINFDTFDRNPEWPIISSSAGVFYPPMMAGYLSTSVHVEWVRWMTKRAFGMIPRTIIWIFFRFVLPILWKIASVTLFPIKSLYALPPCPTEIPDGSWWTGRNIAKPQYNSEMSERIGCSLSYRWSKKRGYEWRVSYWHSYLPTMLAYQQFLSQLQERLRGSVASTNSKKPSSPSSLSPPPSTLSKAQSKTNWWRKHTASLGVSTSGPIPDTPPISCSANLSLSGLYWGARQVINTSALAKSTVNNAAGPRTNSLMTEVGGTYKESGRETSAEMGDENTPSPTRVLAAPIKKSSSVS